MATLFLILSYVCGLVSVGCFIYVVVMMFQHEQTGLGVACVVLFFCAFIGMLLAFIMGWVKASELGTGKIMPIWTAAAVIGFVSHFVSGFAAVTIVGV